MVGTPGIEPRSTGSEPAVLPLHQIPIKMERPVGDDPTTPWMATTDSTAELRTQNGTSSRIRTYDVASPPVGLKGPAFRPLRAWRYKTYKMERLVRVELT